MVIFGEVGQGFTFAQKIVDKQQKMFLAWLAEQQEQTQTGTPGKASSEVQSMRNENILPPSLQRPFDDLMQNMTPQSKSSAATSQEMLSQKSNNSDAVSQDHRNPTPPPADLPILRENWLSRPQTDDPKETRNPLPLLVLLKPRKKDRKRREAQPKKLLKPLSHLALFSCSSTHIHNLTP